MALRAAVPALLLVAAGAQATVAFSNLGAGDSFETSVGYTISGPSSVPGHFSQGEQFMAGASGSITTIRMALNLVSGTDAFKVTLYEDSGSDTLGSWMSIWWGGGMGSFGSSSLLTLTNAFPSLTLTAGQKYWLVAEADSADTWAAWNFNNTGGVGRHVVSAGGGEPGYSETTQGAFEVNVEVVPEPATMAAVGAGLFGLAARRRRK